MNGTLLRQCLRFSSSQKIITYDMVNPCVKNMKFEIRGPLLLRALEIQEELRKGQPKPFSDVIRANIGDCHATGQKPITYLRQLLAACTYPELMNIGLLPIDIKERARRILDSCDGKSLGAYSNATGLQCLKDDAAEYIEKRDGYKCDPNEILPCGGATDAVRSVLKVVTNNSPGHKTGIMIPVPQYPLYSAAIAENGAEQVHYILDEDRDWGLNVDDIQKAYDAARDKCQPRVIVIINPGNPTGQLLHRSDIENVIKFAHKNRVLIIADEVYQQNVYVDDRKFVSFRKCMMDMGEPYSNMELVSLHSASKGYMGECGARGGYFECLNWDKQVFAELVKLLSTPLCPSVWGQALMDGILNPPKKGEPSYELFKKESTQIMKDLRIKAELVTDLLNQREGITCNRVMGSMYAFPRLHLPQKFMDKAKEMGLSPDVLYCKKVLEHTGVCILPGAGFLQKEGTYHFRTTILPPVEAIKSLLSRIGPFHDKLMAKYK
ncbi:hypothetical protein ACOME3_008277 [Neoechinorhynchus agilis]